MVHPHLCMSTRADGAHIPNPRQKGVMPDAPAVKNEPKEVAEMTRSGIRPVETVSYDRSGTGFDHVTLL